MELRIRLYTTQSCEYLFRQCLFSLSFDVCSFVGGLSSRGHNNNSGKQRQSLPNIFAVTVIVV